MNADMVACSSYIVITDCLIANSRTRRTNYREKRAPTGKIYAALLKFDCRTNLPCRYARVQKHISPSSGRFIVIVTFT